LGKQLIEKFKLDADKDAQTFAIGIKELWEIPEVGSCNFYNLA
jgi:electron-transferring-flavoprotein dehydrogenase